MKKCFCVTALLCAISFSAGGQENLVITSLSGNGMMSWTYPTNGVEGYQLEWAAHAEGPWMNTWDGLENIAATGETMSAEVPMFYRVAIWSNHFDYMIVNLAEGPGATNYPVSYTDEIPEGGWGDEYKTMKMVLRRIPAGTFMMGSPPDELGRESDEPQHPVTLTKDFYIGVFEVTQEQWYRVTGVWTSYYTNAACCNTRPVERVSYNDIRGSVEGTNWPASSEVDANSFMGLLRAKTGRAFDLPTEAQWEYACRAGTVTALNSGYNMTNTSADTHMDAVGRYKYNGGSGYSSTGDTSVGSAKAGSYQPNAWGLYDMHGNVWEWSLDWYESTPAVEMDPTGPISGSFRVTRGGGWLDSAGSCRSALRNNIVPGRYWDIGFRLALP